MSPITVLKVLPERRYSAIFLPSGDFTASAACARICIAA
jgi:hypothetical protein